MEHPNTRPYKLPSDAVWFITGCSSGIGNTLASLIAKSPNRVIATARKPETLSNVPDSDNVLKLQLDVTSIPSVEAAIKAAVEKFGRIDVLVNNAGYSLIGDTEAATDEEARAVLDTNFWGMVNVTTRVLPVMREVNANNGGQQGGVIVNITSVGGWAGFPGQAFYHASKFAMEGWSEAVAKELPLDWNIHLCNIEPGGVKTNYATSSMMQIAEHPAYRDPNFPTNQMKSHLFSEQVRSMWTDPEVLAKGIYQVVARGQKIPVRVPLGLDAWSLLDMDLKAVRQDIDELKDLCMGVGDPSQWDSVDFLK